MNKGAQGGFTLLEMVCVLALIAMMTAVLLPFVPRQTSRARLQAYALQAATLLKQDRNAAIRRGTDVTTLVDAGGRVIRSGASADIIRIPNDVQFEAVLPRTCGRHEAFFDHQLLRYRNVVRRGDCADSRRCRIRDSR
jgi:general secretion pathway protein H